MKRIVLATALVAITGFAAVAQTAPVTLSAAIQTHILSLVPGADLSNLTTAQYARFVTMFLDSDNLSSGANPSGAIKAILGAQ